MNAAGPPERRSPHPGLGTRLFLAQLLVVLVGAATMWLLVAAAGPPIFRRHLRRAAGTVDATTARHVEEAFRSATTVSITVAMSAALVAAALLSWFATRRIARPVNSFADAAGLVAAGRYDVHVDAAGLGSEFTKLASAFTVMADRLDAMERTRRRLLSDLAHEMRTPVAVLDGYLEGVEDGVTRLDDETIGVLRNQTARLARLAEDVAAVSRVEERQVELHLERLDPVELVETAAAAAHGRFVAKGVTLVSSTPHDLPQVVADPERIGQVLGNLLDNALRHTPAGGSVTISARAGGSVTIGARAGESGTIAIVVADTGDGIPREHLAHVFERFYRVDKSRDRIHGGSGIGLTIAKALTEAHGGRLTAASPGPGSGSTFTVELPAG